MPLRAIIWDVDGTLAETERDGHLVAFNLAFEALNLPWRWGQRRYGELFTVTGGFERLLFDMAVQATAPVALTEREQLARRKVCRPVSVARGSGRSNAEVGCGWASIPGAAHRLSGPTASAERAKGIG